MVSGMRRVAAAASAVLLAAAECVSASAGGLHLFPRPAAPAPPAGVKGADVMTSMAHCMHMSKTFNLPYNEEPSFGVLNHERGVHLAKAGMSDRPQLWVLTTGFEDAPSGEFAFDADATTYDHVESFAGDASKYGSVDVVCGGVSPSMSHVESSKRRVHQFDGKTMDKFAKLHPRDAEKFSSKHTADKEFAAEIVGMYECVDHVVEGSSRRAIVSLRALEDLLTAHGVESEQYAAAKRVFKDAVAKVQAKFAAKHSDAVSGLVTVPAHLTAVSRWMAHNLHKRAIPSAEWKSNGLSTNPRIAALQICSPTAADCEAVSLQCSSHGSCVKTAVMVANASAIPVADRDKVAEAKFCYVCDCNVVAKNGTGPQWTGDMCQYQEISSQFHLLFWATVLLLVIVILTLHFVFSTAPDSKQD